MLDLPIYFLIYIVIITTFILFLLLTLIIFIIKAHPFVALAVKKT